MVLGIEISSISTIISQYLFWFSVNQYYISSILAHQQIKEISSIYTWKNRQLIIWQFELINANCDHWFLLGNWAIKIWLLFRFTKLHWSQLFENLFLLFFSSLAAIDYEYDYDCDYDYDYTKMKLPQLKDICHHRKLKVTGNKPDLIGRLLGR